MGKRGMHLPALLVLILTLAPTAQAFQLTDPTGFYSTFIGDQWVYQAHYSTPQFLVFYGEGDGELLYFERLGKVSDPSSEDLARRSLDLYAAPGGLEEFRLERELQEVEVAGERGAACAYSYQDSQGTRLYEFRIFLVLPGGEGFSLALGDSSPWVLEDPPLLEEILSHWRWLF